MIFGSLPEALWGGLGAATGQQWDALGGRGRGADPVTDYRGGKGGPFYGFESGQDPQAKKPVCATNINARVWARRRAKARWRININKV